MQRSLVSALLLVCPSIFSLASDLQPRTCHVQVVMSSGAIPAKLKLQVFDGAKRIRETRVPETGSVTIPDLAPGDYRIQSGGTDANFLTAGPLHVPASGPCELGFTIVGRTDAHNNLTEDDVEVEDLRISPAVRSLFQGAFTQFEHGELQKAKEAFIQVTKAAPKLSRAYNILGVISNQQGDRASGRQYFERALELNPRSRPALMNLAKLSIVERRFDDALGILERYRIGTPDIADVHAMEAETLLKLGRYNEAIQEAKAAHVLPHPNWASVHVIAAASYEALHQPDFAVSEYRQFIQECNQQPMRERAAQRISELTSVASQQPSSQQSSQIPMNSLVMR
jgi:Flp pilus assembly protein TadD